MVYLQRVVAPTFTAPSCSQYNIFPCESTLTRRFHPVMAKLHVCARFGGEPAAFSVGKADCCTSFAGVEKSRADFIWLPLFKGWLEVSQKRPAGAQQHLSVTLTRIARSVHASPTHPPAAPAPFEQEGCRTPPAPTQHLMMPFFFHLRHI